MTREYRCQGGIVSFIETTVIITRIPFDFVVYIILYL